MDYCRDLIICSAYSLGSTIIAGFYENAIRMLMRYGKEDDISRGASIRRSLSPIFICLYGPIVEEILFTFPFLGDYAPILARVCSAFSFNTLLFCKQSLPVLCIHFLQFIFVLQGKYCNPLLKILSRFFFVLDHSIDNSSFHKLRALLFYLPISLSLDLLPHHLHKKYQRKTITLGFPIVHHVLNNSLAIYNLQHH